MSIKERKEDGRDIEVKEKKGKRKSGGDTKLKEVVRIVKQ